MSRSRWSSVLALVVLALAFSGTACRKKPPATPATAPPAASAPAAAPAPAPQAATSTAETAPDPWSGDLESVNAYAREKGLLGDVYFDYDRSELRADARDRLAANARFLAEYPQFVVTVEGHCDERGTAEYNLALGQRRARTALDYVGGLADASRLQAVSYGRERPVCSESDESCWWKNRRAAFVVTGRTGG